MKELERSALVAYSAEQMYHLVNDVESYPKFMPGCSDAKIVNTGDNWMEARLDLKRGSFTQSFTTRNTLTPSTSMHLTLVDGPFSTFDGHWYFEELGEQESKVTFTLAFKFKNRIFGLAASPIMEMVAGEQVSAVCQRAKQVYGSSV